MDTANDHGRTGGEARPGETERLRKRLSVDPWAGGGRDLYIVIKPEQISGRRVRAW